MSGGCDVSVIISTHNRCDVLMRTLDSLVAQESRGTSFEVIIVDNNSSDDTREAVRSRIAAGHPHVRLLFEQQPGVSYGRNAGINAAAAPLFAFTDDDVCVGSEWVANIKRAFDEHAAVDYITGRVFPRWEGEKPSWLTPDNWGGPCVLRDRGSRPIFSQPGKFFPGWATANLAVRRRLVERIGMFSGEFARGEDLEFILRAWRAQARGMYAPDVIVVHRVPADRMTKAYHRGWHVAEGRIRARLRFKEIFDVEGCILNGPVSASTVFGTPPFLYRQLLLASKRWLLARLRGPDSVSFKHECEVRQLASSIRCRRRAAAAEDSRPSLSRMTALATGLVKRNAGQLAGEVSNGLPPRTVRPRRIGR
jgi:GT2 family glycosyltransferase